MSEIHTEWLEMINSIGAKNMLWGIHGGTEWISYKQNAGNDFTVQIFTHDGFEVYNKQKSAVIDFFKSKNCVLVSESEVKDISFGYWKQLEFVDQDKHNLKIAAEEELIKKMAPTNIGNQFNAPVHTDGGSFNSGNAESIDNRNINSTEDDKWFQKEIVKIILSFIGGVGATLAAQWIIRLLGWM